MTDHNLIVRYPRLIHMYGLITTRIGLKLPLQSSFFYNSKAVVKCTSTISPVFWGISSSSSSSAISSSSSSSSSSMMTMINGPSARKESVAQATRHHSVIDSREDTFIGESNFRCCVSVIAPCMTDSLPSNWFIHCHCPFSLCLVTVHSMACPRSVSTSFIPIFFLLTLLSHWTIVR